MSVSIASTSSLASPAVYVTDGLKPPSETPVQFRELKFDSEEPLFDPKIHLQLEPPHHIRNLDFQDTPFPYENPNEFNNFAYTPTPFRLLSDCGAETLRAIIDKHKKSLLRQGERTNSVRGLGYLSQFVREFTYDPSILTLLSQLAQQDIHPHDAIMNHCHTNIGTVGNGKAVDQWHVDSVDYVCILIVSDTTNMKGGELQVLQLSDATGTTFDTLKELGIPSELVRSVSPYPPGYCLFMKGSKLLHSVSPVQDARESRYSVVQSYTSRNVFEPDLTRLDPFRDQFGDPKEIADLEYARHKAWRVAGQLDYLMKQLPFGTETEAMVGVMEAAAMELLQGSRLLRGEISDIPGFLVNENDVVTTTARDRNDYASAESKQAED